MKTVLSDSTGNKAPESVIGNQNVSEFKRGTLIRIHKMELACLWTGGILTMITILSALVPVFIRT